MKKTRFLSLLIVAVMLLSLIPAMSFATAAEATVPNILPDLGGEGIGIMGFGYNKNDYPKYANLNLGSNSGPHTITSTTLGKLTNSTVQAAGGCVLPLETQGKAFLTQSLYSSAEGFEFKADINLQNSSQVYTVPVDNVTIPSNAAGFLIKMNANNIAEASDWTYNAAVMMSPVFSDLGTGKSLRTSAQFGTYVYIWDSANSKWVASTLEWVTRIDTGKDIHIYIPFETWQVTQSETLEAGAEDPGFTTADAIGKTLTGFEFLGAHYTWGKVNYPTEGKVFSVDLVVFDTSDTDEWDGTADTSWFDENNIQTEYYLDTAEKVAGLAKIVKDKATSNFPYAAAGNKLVTFYITKNLDLKDMEWLPIGNTYANRFGGSIVGALGGDKNVPITISNMKISNNGDNTGFIGTIDGVEKTTGTVVKNLNFVNANVTNPTDTCNAIVVGYARSGGLFENITVTGSTLSNAAEQGGGASWHGGIVAYSKYGSPIRFKNCVFDGTISIGGTTQTVGAIIGEATVGAALDGCYVGGEIITSASCNNVGGMVGMVKEADKPLAIQNSQMNANISVGVDSGAGAFVGSATNATVAKSIYTGVGFYKNGTSATVLPLLGAGTLTATDIYTRIKVANATQKGKELLGDTAKTTLTGFDFEATWTVRAGMVPVLTVAKDIATKAYANADLTWYDPAKTEMGIASFEQLVGLTYIGRYDPFAEKTVKLTADIDGSAKIEGQETLVLGRQEEGGVNCIFLGTYDKGAFDITNVEFERLMAEGKFLITWIVGNQTFEEEYSYGETPVFKGSTDRADDKKYTYEFTGWDPVIVPVTGPATYDAIWLPVKKEEATTAPETEEITEPATEADTTPAEKEGCGAAMTSFAVIAVMAMAASGVALFKKKKED